MADRFVHGVWVGDLVTLAMIDLLFASGKEENIIVGGGIKWLA